MVCIHLEPGQKAGYEIGDGRGTDLQGPVGNVRILNFIMAVGSHCKVLKQGSYIIKTFS